ncbi:hypothetical protein D9M72_382590 [compost metagenome]
MGGRETAGRKFHFALVGRGQLHLDTALFLMRRSAHFLVQLLVGERARQEAEIARLQILIGGRLLIREANFLAGVDLGDEAEADRVALARRTIEFIDHATIHSGNARTIRRILELKIIDGAMRHEDIRTRRRST